MSSPKYDKINFIYRNPTSIFSPYMYFEGIKTALERNGLLHYAFDVTGSANLDINELLKYPILCITGSSEPLVDLVSYLHTKQFIAEICPESLCTNQGDLKTAYYEKLQKSSVFFDLYFSGIEADLDAYWGKPCYWLPSWAHTEILGDFYSSTIPDKIGFIGQTSRRDAFFSQEGNGILLATNTVPQSSAMQNLIELCKGINTFRMLVNPESNYVMGMPGKNYEIMACNRLCFNQLNERSMFKSKLLFRDNEDVVYFETFAELEAKYHFYLDHSNSLEKVAMSGYHKVRQFHNADVRARQIAERVLHHANGGSFDADFNSVERFTSCNSKQVFSFYTAPLGMPFMNDFEIKAIAHSLQLFERTVDALEWGSGNSTLYFSQYLSQNGRWKAIEHNSEWAVTVQNKITLSGRSNISLDLIPPSGPFVEGSNDGSLDLFREYVFHPASLNSKFNFILVDGRARVECMSVAWQLLTDDGIMVLHDAQRPEYDPGIPENSFCLKITNRSVTCNNINISTLFMSKEADVLDKLHDSLLEDLPAAISIKRFIGPNLMTSHKRSNDGAIPITDYSNSLQALNDRNACPLEGKHVKFMQVHTFYQAYLDDFYRQHPECAQYSFSEQINALVRDGFSANHMMAPYLDQQGYEASLVIANNPHSQAAWTNENKMPEVDRNNWLYDVVRRQIELLRPDVLYLSDPIAFDSQFVRSLSYRPQLVLGWRAADIPSETDWSEFDVMLSCLSGLRNVARTLGAKSAEHFFPGFPVWMNGLTETVQPTHDVVFSGSWTPVQHQGRNNLLAAVAADSYEKYSCAFYLNAPMNQLPPEVARLNKGARFGVDMYRALRSGRIVLDARAQHTFIDKAANRAIDMGGAETANMRIFEATGCGSFLLTEHFDNLSDFFEIGTEIETFRDAVELKEKIHYYLTHPEEREKIARRGQERCLRDYSMERRAEEFDRIISRHLSVQAGCTSDMSVSVAELKRQAVQILAAGDLKASFELLVEAKALKQPLEGLDLMRAHCFMQMNQPMGAIEALREELRWFPGNQDAEQMLTELLKMIPERPVESLGDAEFQQLLVQIRPYTMLSEQRLYSLYSLAKHICESNIPGNFVECGVAAGGSSALLAYVIKHHSKSSRRLFSFDSFSGMPRPTELDSHQGVDAESTGWGTGTCSAPEASVRDICAKLGVEDVLTTVKGYFEDTLPQWRDRVGMIALLHLDGDWYSSTRAILDNLYDRIVNDGVLQIDDYGHWEGCRKAIHEFEHERNLSFNMTVIDGTGVWCVKPDRFPANPAIPVPLQERFAILDPIPKGIEGQMSLNERFQLFHVITQVLPPLSNQFRFIEVGSFAGGSLLLTYLALKEMGAHVQGFSVDPGRHPSLLKILEFIGPEVSYLPMFSHEAVASISQNFQDGNLPQFIFIDGDHTYAGVKRDIIEYYPLLAPGGIMLLHDWLPPLDELNREAILYHHGGQEPGIRQACEEVLEQTYGLTPLDLPLLYPTDPTQTQAHLPIIPGVFSTIRAYRKQG